MSAKDSYKPMGPLDPAYITKVYVPSALLVFVVAYVKANWTPFAVAAAAILAGLQFYGNRAFIVVRCQARLYASLTLH